MPPRRRSRSGHRDNYSRRHGRGGGNSRTRQDSSQIQFRADAQYFTNDSSNFGMKNEQSTGTSGQSRYEENRRQYRGRGRRSTHRTRQEHKELEATTSSVQSEGSKALEIPGFYYDESKKKYFRILPGQFNVQGGVTRETIKFKLAEKRRQEDLAEIGKNVASSFLQQHSESSLHPKCILRSPKFSDNVYTILERMRCSHFTEKMRSPFLNNRKTIMNLVCRIKPAGKLKIFENPSSSYEKLEQMLHMKVNEEQGKILCLWGLREQIVQRIQMLNINGINKYDGDGSIDIDVSPTGAVLLQSFSKVTDMCWAPLEGSDPLDCCILYTTTCFLGNNPSLALLRRLDTDSSQGFRHTEFNLGQKATWACAWNGKSNQLSVGSEECALLLDVPTRRMWELHTGNSDVRSQAFLKDSASMLYSGTKKGIIYGHDLRTIAVRPAVLLKQRSCVCQVQFPRNLNYLFAADFSGKIKQWDLRQRKVVVEFQGHNEYSRTPFHIDTTETIISSAGQDCYTRLWDIQSGRLLTSIPPPHPASRETIPPCHLFSLPCNTVRQPGLLMGSHDELHFYSHH